MAKELISDTTLRALKDSDTTYNGKKQIHDGSGLYLLLGIKGNGRAWRLDYTIAGKRKTISLGTYPDTTLKLARRLAEAARQQVAAGIDPSADRKQKRAKDLETIQEEKLGKAGLPSPKSFEFIAREWFAKESKSWSLSHTKRTLAYLENDLFPYIGKTTMQTIEAPTLLECLRRVEERGALEAANRLRALCGQIWRYAITQSTAERKIDVKRDIAADLIGAIAKHTAKNFSYIKDPKQLGQLLRDIEGYAGTPIVKAALRTLPRVFTRPSEFRFAKWADIDFEKKEWRYVATKTNADHIVPLADQVIAEIESIKPLTGNGEYIFSVRDGMRPISENTINQALKSLGYTSDIIQPHGFRHTAATMLAELGWNTEAIERQLAHKEAGIKAVYQKAQYLDERKRMMQAWSDYIDSLKAGAQVIPFKTA